MTVKMTVVASLTTRVAAPGRSFLGLSGACLCFRTNFSAIHSARPVLHAQKSEHATSDMLRPACEQKRVMSLRLYVWHIDRDW